MEAFGTVVAIASSMIISVFLVASTINALINYNLDPSIWQCTKTEIVGNSPNKYEVCLQYTNKKVK